MNFGERLKFIRTYDLHTQQEISQYLNITKSTYCQYENQYRTIPLVHLNTFCNKMNISLDYFFKFTKIKNYKINNYDINEETVINRIKLLRKEKNITQNELATSINYERSAISRYENEINSISTSFLYAICTKYNISADYLLGKIDSPKYLK